MKVHPTTEFQEGVSGPIDLSELGLNLKTTDASVARPPRLAKGTSKSESSPDYFRTIAYLNSDWRLILCKTGIQWILQRRKGLSKWEGYWFARTKEGLLGGLGRCGETHEAALRRIHELPERCEH